MSEPQSLSPEQQAEILALLRAAKQHSDAKRYELKHASLRSAIQTAPAEFERDDSQTPHPGVEHKPSGFRMHAPKHVLEDVQVKAAGVDPNLARSIIQRALKVGKAFGGDAADRFTMEQLGLTLNSAKRIYRELKGVSMKPLSPVMTPPPAPVVELPKLPEKFVQMDLFKSSSPFVKGMLEREGGTKKVTVDSGGVTKGGIAESNGKYTAAQIRKLTPEQINQFWEEHNARFANFSDPGVRTIVSDWTGNAGPTGMLKTKRILNSMLPADQQLDVSSRPLTSAEAASVSALRQPVVAQRLLDGFKQHHEGLVKANPKRYKTYAVGWANRRQMLAAEPEVAKTLKTPVKVNTTENLPTGYVSEQPGSLRTASGWHMMPMTPQQVQEVKRAQSPPAVPQPLVKASSASPIVKALSEAGIPRDVRIFTGPGGRATACFGDWHPKEVMDATNKVCRKLFSKYEEPDDTEIGKPDWATGDVNSKATADQVLDNIEHECEWTTCKQCGRVSHGGCKDLVYDIEKTKHQPKKHKMVEQCRSCEMADRERADGCLPEVTKAASHFAALRTARAATNTNPTDGQKHQGNYAKGELTLHGLKIKIENPKGAYRSGVSKAGKAWKNKMYADYGYFAGTKAVDGDAVDCFIGPDLKSEFVVAIDQYDGDKFDETKFILGTKSKDEASNLYLKHYERGWKLGPVTTTTVHALKDWLKNGETKKPFAGQMVKAAHSA